MMVVVIIGTVIAVTGLVAVLLAQDLLHLLKGITILVFGMALAGGAASESPSRPK